MALYTSTYCDCAESDVNSKKTNTSSAIFCNSVNKKRNTTPSAKDQNRGSLFDMDMPLIFFFSFGTLLSTVSSQSCDITHYQRCLDQLLAFTEKGNLIFGSNSNNLHEECLSAQSALGCLTRYSKKCLPLEERPNFAKSIAGPERVVLGICLENSDLRTKYLEILPCLKNLSDNFEYCREKFERNNRDILVAEYEDKTHLQCCSFEGYRRCLHMVTETQEGCSDQLADVIDEIAVRMGGIFLEETCSEYDGRCLGSGANTQTCLNTSLLVIALILSKFILNTWK